RNSEAVRLRRAALAGGGTGGPRRGTRPRRRPAGAGPDRRRLERPGPPPQVRPGQDPARRAAGGPDPPERGPAGTAPPRPRGAAGGPRRGGGRRARQRRGVGPPAPPRPRTRHPQRAAAPVGIEQSSTKNTKTHETETGDSDPPAVLFVSFRVF